MSLDAFQKFLGEDLGLAVGGGWARRTGRYIYCINSTRFCCCCCCCQTRFFTPLLLMIWIFCYVQVSVILYHYFPSNNVSTVHVPFRLASNIFSYRSNIPYFITSNQHISPFPLLKALSYAYPPLANPPLPYTYSSLMFHPSFLCVTTWRSLSGNWYRGAFGVR